MKTDTQTVRLPVHVKEYFKKHGVNIRTILEQKYYEMKSNEVPELLKEKEKALQRVAQIDSIVPHLQASFNENNNKLDKLCYEFLEHRDIDNLDSLNKNWINSRCKKENMSVDMFIKRCREIKEKKGR